MERQKRKFFQNRCSPCAGKFLSGLGTRAAALKVGEGLGRITADFWQLTWQSGKRREEICTELKEKFGEKNQKIQVL